VIDDFVLDGAVGALSDVADAGKGVGHLFGGAARLCVGGSGLIANQPDNAHRKHESRRSGHPSKAVAPALSSAVGGGIPIDGSPDVFHDPRWWVEIGKRTELREDPSSRRGLAGTARARVNVPVEILGDRDLELIVEHGIDKIEGEIAAHGFNR